MSAELQARVSVVEARIESVKDLPIQFARVETEVKGLREQQKTHAVENKELLGDLKDDMKILKSEITILKSEITEGKGIFIGAGKAAYIGAMSVSAFFGAIISKLVSLVFK